jgi:tungstate transport system ATP-binding protein
LDGKTTLEIEKLLQNSAENGTTIMMSTHDIGQAKRLAKNILFLNKGKLESTQPAQIFFREPISNNARKFIAGEIVE